MTVRIGIDVGGTFTDVVLVDDKTGKIFITKTLTMPKKLSDGVINGIEKILKIGSSSIKDVDYIVHGTTIGTNALIERKGVKTGLVTTEGFRDVLEIGRIQRPAKGLYDFSVDTPMPLVPRYLRREVKERVGSDGGVVTLLDDKSVKAVVDFFKREEVESIAVGLLFSFLKNRHERQIKKTFNRLYPKACISLSSDIAPEFREFERTSTTVINAYLEPIVQRYIEVLVKELKDKYGKLDLRIMQASGGCMTAHLAKRRAVQTVNSGPAGGVIAASFIGRLAMSPQIISVDMGGTSFDIGVITEGKARTTSESKFEGFPVKIPTIDVHAIGAGGGSVAHVDKGGVLNVGPMSAGADPGPACYGLGETNPTVTDANLVLGRLNPDYFLGGEMRLELGLARKAIEKHIAKPMKISIEEATYGIIRVVNANMAKGISVSSTEKGYDIREFALVAFGGAGPLHACEIAEELQMQKVIIPPCCGDFSALGLLVSDTKHDFVKTIMKKELEVKPEGLTSIFKKLEKSTRTQLRNERIKEKDIELLWSADLRFTGQSYELNVPVIRKNLTKQDIRIIIKAFSDLHEKIYAFSSVDEEVEFVNLRVTGIGKTPIIRFSKRKKQSSNPKKALKEERKVYFASVGFLKCQVYERELLRPGNKVKGPGLVEEVLSTTVIPPGWIGEVDEYGNIIIKHSSKR